MRQTCEDCGQEFEQPRGEAAEVVSRVCAVSVGFAFCGCGGVAAIESGQG